MMEDLYRAALLIESDPSLMDSLKQLFDEDLGDQEEIPVPTWVPWRKEKAA